MKQTFVWLMLVLSITGDLFAQEKSDQVFSVPGDFIFRRKFNMDLEKGNKLRMEIGDINDLSRIYNVDSILEIFVKDLGLLGDSLQNPLTSKRIEYMLGEDGINKIRFIQHQGRSSSFVVKQSELASLRIDQDTVIIIGTIPNPPAPHEKISLNLPRYYRISLFLNSIDELKGLMDGRITIKMKGLLENHGSAKWYGGTTGWGNYKLKTDPSITADRPRGVAGAPKDFLTFSGNVAVQNYKKYFVPSFGVGASLILSNRERTFRREIGLVWEPMFTFSTDSSSKSLKTYMSHFLTLVLSQGMVKEHDPRKETSFLTTLSISYLISNRGDMFVDNTLRLGMGKLKLAKTTIEPCLYFNDFFQGVTPSLRIVQSF